MTDRSPHSPSVTGELGDLSVIESLHLFSLSLCLHFSLSSLSLCLHFSLNLLFPCVFISLSLSLSLSLCVCSHFSLYLVVSVSSSLPLSHTHSLPLFLSHSLYSIPLILFFYFSTSFPISLFLFLFLYLSLSISLPISLAPGLCRFVFVSYCLLQFIQWIGFVVTACFLAACAGSHDALLNPNSIQEVDGFRTYFTVSKGEVSAWHWLCWNGCPNMNDVPVLTPRWWLFQR